MISIALVNPMAENTVAKAVMHVLSKTHYKIDLGIAGHVTHFFTQPFVGCWNACANLGFKYGA